MFRPKSVLDRLIRFSKVNAETGCREWTSAIVCGYGQLSVGNKPARAHRAAYQEWVGQIPDGMLICHRCDNKRCIEPTHLFLGTHQDNMTDKMAKGRHVSIKGSGHANAKLTYNDVIGIRYAVAMAGCSQQSMAESFGVSQGTIQRMVTGERWGHFRFMLPG